MAWGCAQKAPGSLELCVAWKYKDGLLVFLTLWEANWRIGNLVMNIIINGDLQIVSESATDTVFTHLQKRVGGKAKSLGMFKWECSSLDFAIKWRRMRLQLPYLCLFWGKPFEERHETADETAATVMQGLGKVSCDQRGKHLQLCGQKRCERSCALCRCGKSSYKGQAVNIMSGRNEMCYQGHLCE